MNSNETPDEPLNNIELESAILGLRMALNPEEEVESRKRFLDQLRVSTLVVPTVQPVPTLPDGPIVPNSDITFVVVETTEGETGVPGFTTLKGLKETLPDANNGLFLNGAQLASILASSPHKLFIDGPEMHTVVEQYEMAAIAEATLQDMQAQQAAAERNSALEAALDEVSVMDNATTREALTNAFLNGFCRIPIANEADVNAKVVMLRAGNPQGANAPQDIPLLTENDSLLCFTSDDALHAWRSGDRGAVALPGAMIADLAAGTGIPRIAINHGADTSRSLKVEQNRITVV